MSQSLEKFDHVDLLFPSQYVKAADLHGEDVVVEIEDIEPRHELKRKPRKGEKQKDAVDYVPVVYMVNRKKMWVLNRTNADTIAELYGPNPNNWKGKRVILYPARDNAFGKMVDCIRVRPKRPGLPDESPPHDPVTGEVTSVDQMFPGGDDADTGPSESGSEQQTTPSPRDAVMARLASK